MRTERKRPKFLRYVLIVAGIALFILIFFGGSSGIFRIIALEHKKKALAEEVLTLKVNMEILREKKKRLEQDIDYIEKIARQRFGMVQPDTTNKR